MDSEGADLARHIARWVAGDAEALNHIMPLLYARLREIAHLHVARQPAGLSLNTTELVHEAYLRLARAGQVKVKDRAHFLALSSRVMRNLLVDHVRARQAAKRGGGLARTDLESLLPIPEDQLDVLSALDDALQRLERLNPRQGRILEQRYFGGLSLEETATALGVSLATVKRELRSARAWLGVELETEPQL